ncbi:MAG TPA: FAD-dependent oxidoreductase [Aggregatilineales bacterium]|nr:FAD-dependent oxidoreductase [Aggregatilineales bacterium]
MSDHSVGSAKSFLKDGAMVRLDLEGTPVVLARVNGQYYAFGGTCTHYGAPLHEGVLRDHELICPWHHACFDIRSGARLEPPALNALPHYPVRTEGGKVIVTLPHDNDTEPQGRAEDDSELSIVIVGGGAAGNAAAEELRREAYPGKITLISNVPEVPVDRPNVSKDYLAGHADPAWMPLRGDESWYATRNISLRLNSHVEKVDPRSHRVALRGGESIRYDKLLLAMGAIPRHLNVAGSDLKNIYLLRRQPDADRIMSALKEKGKRVVVVGASFIGMEVAASLAEGQNANVTVVGIEKVPFDRILGEQIGLMFQHLHEVHGVQFRLNSEVKQFTGKDGQVSGVELHNGETLPADVVVVGIGVRPSTDALADSGLKLDPKDLSVRVNSALQSSDADVYAAGDIARWDDGSSTGVRIEHWRVAEQHGIIAAHNMLGQQDDVARHVPFFWTAQWGRELRYVGHAEQWDSIIYRGDLPDSPLEKENFQFVACYVQSGKLKAAAGCNADSDMDALEFILRDGKPLSEAQMRDDKFDLVAYARGE